MWVRQHAGCHATSLDPNALPHSHMILPPLLSLSLSYLSLLSHRFIMGRTHGLRRGTRYMFARDFRKRGEFGITKRMTIYKVGDIVDVKVRICCLSYPPPPLPPRVCWCASFAVKDRCCMQSFHSALTGGNIEAYEHHLHIHTYIYTHKYMQQ